MMAETKNHATPQFKELRQKKIPNSKMRSYEDLLVSEYLEQLQNKQPQRKTRRRTREWLIENSPYSQPLASSKPDADNSSSKGLRTENISDAYLINMKRRRRPASAPAKSIRSASAVSSLSSYDTSGRKNQRNTHEIRPPLRYRIRPPPHTIVATVYKNGYCDNSARVAAPDLRLLLEQSTEKLQLPFAARSAYFEGGAKINTSDEIPYGASIYVSMGEPYKDPFGNTKKNLEEQKNLSWTLSGITLATKKNKKTRRIRLKRMKTLSAKKKVRIIVYRNGFSTKPVEILTDLSKMEEFLVACTAKLTLSSFARIVYDWEGQEITDLTDTPILNDCIQQAGNIVLGPLWVSTGEVFRPSGTVDFITGLKKLLMKKLKEAQLCYNEVVAVKMGNKSNVSRPEFLSMKENELNQVIAKATEDISDMKETLESLASKLHNLNEQKNEELSQGSDYVMQHIQKLKDNHRLIGTKGLRLKVFENGSSESAKIFYFNLREALKGTEGDYMKLKQRLLDELSMSQRLTNTQRPKLASVVQKLYTHTGEEIQNILTLQNDDEIWLSYGEPFIDPHTYCMQAVFDGVGMQHFEEHSALIRKQTNYKYKNEGGSNQWRIIKEFPKDIFDSQDMAISLEDLKKSQVEESWHLMQHKEKPGDILFPEIVINQKVPKGDNSLGHSESQAWMINKNGVIYSKAIPQLCLTICNDLPVTTKLSSVANDISGYVVALQQKEVSNQAQMWTFFQDGTISTLMHPNFYLTWLGNKYLHKSEEAKNLVQGIKDGHNVFLIAAERLPKKEAALQRWAVKQERFDNLGQWKHTQVSNPEWNKLAYSWPVSSETGKLNEKYDWPMEGYFIPNAPPLSKSGNKNSLSGITPLRLLVLRNGEKDLSKAIPVVGPNVTNMMKVMKEKKRKEKLYKRSNKSKVTANNGAGDGPDENVNVHCSNITVRELEFSMFLDACTQALHLPSAGRRLFDSTGEERHSLQGLSRDQTVYVSCHEPWSDPKMNKTEQQRRILLAQLSSDMNKIRHYCAMRNLENYILKIGGPLCPRSTIVIGQLQEEMTEEKSLPESDLPLDEKHNELQTNDKALSRNIEQDGVKETMSYHDISHARSDKRFNQLKWPWEKLVHFEDCLDNDDDVDEDRDADQIDENYSGKVFYEKFKRRPVPVPSFDRLSRFTYEDNYIACAYNKNLVLGIEPSSSRVVEVSLVKRSPDNINQQWIIKTNGEIQSKYDHGYLLSVSFQSTEKKFTGSDGEFPCEGCPVVLLQAKSNAYGNAHQKWYYDAETGYIHAFQAEVINKEITVANQMNVCTFAITSEKKINQPGYIMDLQEKSEGNDEDQKVMLCESCAHTMRGKFSMQKLESEIEFFCAMGKPDMHKLHGSFQILNNKVDLSTHEALLTLQHWEEKMQQMREISSVHAIATEIAATQNVHTVKLLAYKNGDGRLRNGQLIIGSSIEGLLQQCTQRLGLANAARKMYTEDGSLMLKIDDLVKQSVANCKSEFEHQVDKYIKEKQNAENRLNNSKESCNSEQETEQFLPEEDQKENEKLSKERELLLRKVSLPPLNVILNFPIEVWVSSGRQFIPPEVVESKEENRKKKRTLCADIALELDLQKHILRQVKGRRLEELHPGDYQSTQNSKQPVVITGHWAQPTSEECVRQNKVHKLQNHLNELKANQNEVVKMKPFNPKITKRLYKQPDTKRIKVYPNGETYDERGVYICGSSLEEILEQCTEKLGFWKKAKLLYTTEGELIESFKDIQRDDMLCVSTGQPFLNPMNCQQDVQLKAEWARARKIHGPQITDITVTSERNPVVNVDAFAPPFTRKTRPLNKTGEQN